MRGWKGGFGFLWAPLLVAVAGAGVALWFSVVDKKRDDVKPRPRASDIEQTAEKEHPLGRPVRGGLPWEGTEKFARLRKARQTPVRLSAFQTTLPDPLPGEEYNVALAADRLAGTLVGAGRVFSMNQTLGPYTAGRGFRRGPVYVGESVSTTIGGGVCKIATTLYNVAILAGLEILERRAHGMPVPYVPPGQDATVTYGVQDLRFRNGTAAPVMIYADTRGNTLYMAIYGREEPPKVSWHHQILDRKRRSVIRRPNPALPPGRERIALPGADGLTVRSWVTIAYPDGRTAIKRLGVDRYRPMPKVVEYSPEAGVSSQ